MGKMALEDIGYKDTKGNWTQKAKNKGIYSNSDFLRKPNVQDQIFVELCRRQWYLIKHYKLHQKVGQKYIGTTITESGLLAATHLVGASGLNRAITNGTKSSDAYNTNAHDYMRYMSGYNIKYIQ